MSGPATARLSSVGPTARLSSVGPTARLSSVGPTARLTVTDLRVLPWVGSWDTSSTGGLSDTEWTVGGTVGARDIGPAVSDPSYRRWLSARIVDNMSTGGAFSLEFGELDGATGDWVPVDSADFTVLHERLLDLSGWDVGAVPGAIIPRPTDSPVRTVRYWSLPMPSRAAIGLAAGAFAILQLRVLPTRREQSRWLPWWQPNTDEWWAANDSFDVLAGRWRSEIRAEWKPLYAAEQAANAVLTPINFLFLVSAPNT